MVRRVVPVAVELLARAGVAPGALRAAAAAVGARVGGAELEEWLAGLASRRERAAALLASPGIPQRTPEWYAARETLVTASDLQKLLDCGPEEYCARKAAAAGAWGYLSRQPAIRWGKKYEPVAAAIYSARRMAPVAELGLLLHPRLPGFGASPDGITPDGVLLEFKCPYSRRLNGEVPRAYRAQIQGQLDAAGLDDCDYFEARLGEYSGEADFLADAGGRRDCETREGAEKGAMFLPSGGEDHEWEACPPGGGAEEAAGWARARLAADPGGRATFWYLIDSNLVRVTRDPAFMEAARGAIERCREILLSPGPRPAPDRPPAGAGVQGRRDEPPGTRLASFAFVGM